jgi:hypothetical protein
MNHIDNSVIAAIIAAIEAFTGGQHGKQFVVRSIKRKTNWNK